MKRLYKFLMPMLLLVAMALPWESRAQVTVTIGTGTSTSYYIPFNSLYGYSFTEMVYPATEINMAGSITTVRFYLAQSYTSDQTNSITLYMKNVTRSNFSSTTDIEPVTTADVVFDGNWTIPANYTGWVDIDLDVPFSYDGSSNLMVAMHEKTSGYSTRYFAYTSVTNSGLSYYSDSYNPDPYNLSSYSGSKYLRSYLANMQLDIVEDNASCYAIRNLSVVSSNPDEVVLSWLDTNNASGISYVIVDMADTTVLGTSNDTVYSLSGFVNDTVYRIGVYADCGGGDISRIVALNVPTPPACPVPTQLHIDTITTTEITLSWTPGYLESSWLLSIGDSDVVVTASPYTITDLTLNTLYTLRLRALCDAGDTSIYAQVTARTLAGAPISEFPYTCGFEIDADGNNEASDWVLENGTQTNKWYVGAPGAHNGTNGLYISDNNGTSNSYTTSSISHVYAYATFSFSEVGEYAISYDWRNQGESNYYDWLRVFLAPASQDFVGGNINFMGGSTYAACTTAVAPGWIELSGKTTSPYTLAQSSTWQNVTTTFSVTAPGLYKLVFLWSNDGSGGTQPPASVDNISINRNTCPAPVALTIDTLMPTAIGVHWTSLGDETEWALTVGDSVIDGIQDTFYTVTGLEQYTLYTLKVRAVCGDEDTSLYSSAITGRTTVSCPWPTNFVVNVQGDTANFSWDAGTSSEWELVYDAPGFNPSNSLNIIPLNNNSYQDFLTDTGFYSAYVRAVCGPDDISAWVGPVNFSFGVNIMNMATSGTDTLRSCAAIVYDNGGPTGDYADDCMSTLVILPTSPDREVFISGSSYTEGSYDYLTIYEGVGTSGTVLWTDDGISTLTNFGPFTSSAITVVFESDGSVQYSGFEINVGCTAPSSCPRPINIAVNPVVTDSVTVSWGEAGTSSSWELVVGPLGFNPDTVTSPIVLADSSYVFTNLNGGVSYDVYVRADCGGEYSNWSGPINFIPGQFVMGTSGAATISMCGGVIYDNGGPNGNYSDNVDYTLTIYPASPDSMLTFHGTAYTEGSIDYLKIYEGVGTDGTLLWQTSTSSQQDNIPLDTCVSGPITLKFHTDGSIQYAGFELFVNCVAAPDCSPVEALTVVPSPNGALVAWRPGFYGVYSGATVEYKADSVVDSWTSLPQTTATYAVITGLEPNTDYNVRVTTDCEGYQGGVAMANFTTKNFNCVLADSTSLVNYVSGTGTSQTTGVPVNSSWGNTLCQSIYLASEIAASGTASGPMMIKQITYTWTNNSTYAKQFSIYMTNTTATEFTGTASSNWLPTGAATLVYTGPHPVGTSGSVTYDLATPFAWDGTSNICITTTMNQPAGASHSSSGFYGLSTTTSPNVYRSMYKYQDSNPLDGANPASVTPSSRSYYRPNITLHAETCLQQATCAAPAVAVVDVTTTTVTVAWAPGATETSWNLYYRLAGTTAWSTPVVVTGSTYTVTGLNSGMPYEFKVETSCSEGNFATIVEATTLCAAITLPYTENFNGWGTGHLPNCWYNTGAYSTGSYSIISGTQNMTGATGGSVYMYSSNGASYVSRIILPELDSAYQMNQAQLVFNVKYTSTSYGNPTFVVGVMSDPLNITTFVPVDTVSVQGGINQWENFEVSMANYTGNGAYAAIQTLYPGTYFYCYLDDVTLEAIPTCPRPDSLTASNATTTTVDLAWHERGGATNWVIEYGPRGFQPGTGTMVAAPSNPFTLTGLTPSYQGEYYVRSICSGADTGEYSRRPCAFGTTQIPATLPYNYDFEDPTEWANWQTCSNHDNNWFRGTAVADSGSYSIYMSADGGVTYKPYLHDAVVNATAFRDIDFGPIDSSYTLTIRARAGGTTTGGYDGMIVLLADPSIATVPSGENLMTPWGDVRDLYQIMDVRTDTTWQTYSCSFDTIHGVHRMAFYWFNQATQGSSDYPNLGEPVAVDNIHLDYSSCPRPVSLDAPLVGSTNATLTWGGDASSSYEVVYREVGSNNMVAIANTNAITLTGLTPNATYRAWVRRICGAGDTSLYCDGVEFKTPMCEGGTEATNFDPSASSTTTSYGPIGYCFYNYSYVQTIIDSADLASLGGDITAFAFLPTNTTSSDYYNNMTVYMANVSESNLTNGFILPSATTVFHKVIDSADFSFTTANEWQIHNLDTAFTWDGHSNVLFAVNRQHGTYASSGSFSAHTASVAKMRYIYQDSGPYDYTTVSGGTSSTTVGDIRLISCNSAACPTPTVTADTIGETFVTINYQTEANSVEVAIVPGNWIAPANGTVVSGDSTYTFTGLTGLTDYVIGVRAICGSSVSDWATLPVTTLRHPCAVPTTPQVTGNTYDGATVTWTAGEDETEWELRVFCNSPVYEHTYTVSGTPSQVVDGLDAATTYSVTVRALCDSAWYSVWSDTVDLTTLTCPMVTGVTASNVTATGATI
ncbi:MAG: fibronectin type III domain-containing protein, partial [Bacteroidales bacterium]|nr:fibronectin type III domain-containing protein [Bacteroidales bacterium]